MNDLNDFGVSTPQQEAEVTSQETSTEQSFDPVGDNLDAFEASLAEVETSSVDEFSESQMDFEKFIVLSKKDLTDFCRIVEPLTKISIDEYSKCVYVEPKDGGTVELKFVNTPYAVSMTVANKSNKTMAPFMVSVSNLKKITTSAFASVVLVEQNGCVNIAVCGSLLFLETKPLDSKLYNIDKTPCTKSFDKEIGIHVFNKIGSVLSVSERSSEKVILIKNNFAYVSTSFFASKTKSPFGESKDCILFKAVSDILGIIATLSKVDIKYEIVENMLFINCDGNIYCQLPLGPESKIGDFYSPTIEQVLSFDSNVVVMNDTLVRLVNLVYNLDYLSDIIDIEFTKEDMKITIYSSALTNPSVYSLKIVEGEPEEVGNFKVNSKVLKIFLGLVSTDVKYSNTAAGLGVENSYGKFIVRKN